MFLSFFSCSFSIISRYKVIRYFELFLSEPDVEISNDLLLFIITKDSMLDYNELETIKNIVKKIMNVRSLIR